MQQLNGSRILIVEDNYVMAQDLARYFENLGATVLGPAPTLKSAGPLAEVADAAVLDINLNGSLVFPLADRLAERGVPFVFFSGYECGIIPQRLQHIANLPKPADRALLFKALFPKTGEASNDDGEADEADIFTLLPKLRLAARLMMRDAASADRLVELALELGVKEVATKPNTASTESWLNGLLCRAALSDRKLLQ